MNVISSIKRRHGDTFESSGQPTREAVDGERRSERAINDSTPEVYDTKVITCEPTAAAIGAICPVEIPFARGKN